MKKIITYLAYMAIIAIIAYIAYTQIDRLIDDSNLLSERNITLSEFNSLETGMFYSDVTRIIGSDGELISEASISGTTSKVFTWKGVGSLGANANATFTDGKLVAKAQSGLR